MKLSRAIVFLFAFFLLSGLVYGVSPLDSKSEKEIKTFLSSQKSEHEGAESQGVAISDLNGDGKPELILVWTLLGPTYWRNNLTVLSQTGKGYKVAASLQLIGLAKLLSVENGIIRIDQIIYAKDDPICCPSIEKQLKYRWLGKKIEQLKEPA